MSTESLPQPEDEKQFRDLLAEIAETTRQNKQADQNALDRLGISVNATEQIQRRAEVLALLRRLSIQMTEPEDWVLHQDRDGNQIANPTANAVRKFAPLWQIQIRNVRPLDQAGRFAPDRITNANGAQGYRAWCDATSEITNMALEAIEASRYEDEDFIGRTGPKDEDPTHDGDLRLCVYTLLANKAGKIFSGLAAVSPSVLLSAWENTQQKTLSRCRKGHGFGSSASRQAGKVTDDSAKASAAQLWRSILRRTGGDVTLGKTLLMELTRFKKSNGDEFKGYDDFTRISSAKVVDIAFPKLREHPVWGDKAKGGDAEEKQEGGAE